MHVPRLAIFAAALTLWTNGGRAADWPEFRGPTGQGLAPAAKLPTQLSQQSATWFTPIAGKGWSSPVIAGEQLYVTTAVELDGGRQRLELVCLDAQTGRIEFQTAVFEQPPARIHSKNSHASPTPIIEQDRVYVHFGPHGTACLSRQGDVIWKNEELKYPPVHGNGGSPILVGDLLVFSADGSRDPAIIALHKSDGKVAWKTPRPTKASKKFSFSTPLAIEVDGKTQIISPGSDMVCSLDPATGEILWTVDYKGYSVIPRPVFGHGLVFLSTSYDSPMALAIRPTGQGNVTESHVAWTLQRGAPHTPSMLLDGAELYLVSDRGVATCVDAVSGKEHWRQRLDGNYSASPILAGGHLYFFSEQGQCVVIKPGTTYEEVARSQLDEATLASPAVHGNSLLVRTERGVYRFD
jgi:outer membrane protein assembly factor BamB